MSHSSEFEAVTANRFRFTNKKDHNQIKIWNLDPLLDKYNEIINRGKKEVTLVSELLAAMRMDGNI